MALHNLRQNIASGLMFLLCIILMPVDYIHEIYGHDDTHCHPHTQMTFDKQHHHCELLQYRFSLFLDDYLTVQVYASNHYKHLIIPIITDPAPEVHFNLPPQVTTAVLLTLCNSRAGTLVQMYF